MNLGHGAGRWYQVYNFSRQKKTAGRIAAARAAVNERFKQQHQITRLLISLDFFTHSRGVNDNPTRQCEFWETLGELFSRRIRISAFVLRIYFGFRSSAFGFQSQSTGSPICRNRCNL
jgi:hypothetical protein